MPPREDIRLKVFYRDPGMKENEGRSEAYEGIGETLAHLSLKHAVGVITRRGYHSSGGCCVPITPDELEQYGLKSSDYQDEGPVLILSHDRPINEAKTGNLDVWEIIPWKETVRLIQNQRSQVPPGDIPHLQVPR